MKWIWVAIKKKKKKSKSHAGKNTFWENLKQIWNTATQIFPLEQKRVRKENLNEKPYNKIYKNIQ